MDSHEDFFAVLYDRLVTELDIINEGTRDILTLADLCTDTVRRTITLLKDHVLKNGFVLGAEEINFFKTVKPKFYSLLIYYGKVYELELNRPAGSREKEIRYLKKEEAKLYYFYNKHRSFYQYYRAGSDYLDDKYFMRHNRQAVTPIGAYGIDTDAMFTTSLDFVVSKIEAHEKLRDYIERALQLLQPATATASGFNDPSTDLTWTASKASLIELLYGLHSAGSFNNGTVGIQQVAAFFEKSFHVQLGNYYRAFQEIRIRKKNRTQFLDEVKKKLVSRMDFLDENPKY